jgi:hypothetical protein
VQEEWGAAPNGRGAAHMSLTHANWTLGMMIWTRRICIGFTKPGFEPEERIVEAV